MYVEIVVKTAEPRSIAGRMRDEPKPILLYIPGGSGRVSIVDNKTQYIDSEKSKGKAEKCLLILVKKISGKGQG